MGQKSHWNLQHKDSFYFRLLRARNGANLVLGYKQLQYHDGMIRALWDKVIYKSGVSSKAV